MPESPLIGASRGLLVDGLVSIFDAVNNGDRSSIWISLEAPSGWGKTRIVREFYRRLARTRQYEGRYWPTEILSTPDSASSDETNQQHQILNARKRVHPTLARDGGSLPCWFWWGISASERNGSRSIGLVNDLDQLEQHKVFLLARCKTLAASWGDRHGNTGRELIRLAVDEAAEEFQNLALEGLGLAVPGAGLVISAFRWTTRRVLDSRGERQLIGKATSAPVMGAGADVVEDAVATLLSIARHGLPLIVVIEDLQLADQVLIDVIDKLLKSDRNIMVITTSWPGGVDQDKILKPLRRRHRGPRLIRIRHSEPLVDPAFPVGAGLQTLRPGELSEIVRLFQPRATPLARKLLSERFANPLQLELYCTLPSTKARVRGNAGVLDLRPADLAGIPASLNSMYEAMWSQFPERVQNAFALALCCVPAMVHDSSLVIDNRWDADLVLGVAKSMAPVADGSVFDRVLIDYAWARSMGEGLRGFPDAGHRATVAGHVAEYISSNDLKVLRKAAAACAVATSASEEISNDQRLHRAEMVIALHADGTITDQTALEGACLSVARSLSPYPQEAVRLVRVIDYALTRRPVAELPDSSVLELLALQARGRYETGDVDAARTSYESLLPALTMLLGADHQHTLITRANLARTLQAAGRPDEATKLFADLLLDEIRVLGADHPETLAIRGRLAGALQAAGRPHEAITLFRDVLAFSSFALFRALGNVNQIAKLV